MVLCLVLISYVLILNCISTKYKVNALKYDMQAAEYRMQTENLKLQNVTVELAISQIKMKKELEK